jgi:tetratricopeptide (TPR) repeat protein
MRASAVLLATLAIALPVATAGAAGTPDDRVVAYQEFRGAFDKGDYPTALTAAARVVEMTKSQFGADAQELANPLTNLATTYYRMREYGQALDGYRAAITILETQNDATDPRLVRPLHGMGSALQGMNRQDEALLPLKRGLDILRNRDGLHAVTQLPVLKTLITGYVATGRMADAGREQEYAYTVAEMSYGKQDQRMLGPIDDLARWYEETGRYAGARLLHMRAVQIADTAHPNGVEAIPGLRGVARSFRLAAIYGESQDSISAAALAYPDLYNGGPVNPALIAPSTNGELALRSALSRLAGMPAQAAQRGAILVDLGDWYLTANKLSRAQETWREAWKELEAANDTSLLDKPVAVTYVAPAMAVSRHQRDPAEHSEQRVQIRLAIDANGRVRDATVANPAADREAVEKSVMSAARLAAWRPAFRAGAPVAVDDHLFTELVYVKLPKQPGS